MSYYHPENEPAEETSAYVQKEKESISSLACHPAHTGHGRGALLKTKR